MELLQAIRGNERYYQKLITCGKKACGKCPHGPYWYLEIKLRDGRKILRYVGKSEPALTKGWNKSVI